MDNSLLCIYYIIYNLYKKQKRSHTKINLIKKFSFCNDYYKSFIIFAALNIKDMSKESSNSSLLAYKRLFSNNELCKFVNDLKLSKDDIQNIFYDNDTYTIFYWT